MGQAFFGQGFGWSGHLVKVESSEGADRYQSRGCDRRYGWAHISRHSFPPVREVFNYARYATEDEIDAALRAESPSPTVEQVADNLSGWIEKSWGRTRQVFQAEGVEVWESEGKAGHRTSWHCHPKHLQHLIPVSGVVGAYGDDGGRQSKCGEVGIHVEANGDHELRFATDCRFIEVYTGTGSVMDTIERIYK